MNYLIWILVAYLLGNFSTSYFVGKIAANIDIRNYGSGNAGSTNVLRTLGLKAGAWAFLGDSLKGVIAVFLGKYYGGVTLMLLCGIAVIIGHNWPFVLRFKGGKGIATSIGVGLFVQPLSALICIIIGVIILFRFKYVSLASITAISLLPFVFIIHGTQYFLFGLALAIMAVYRHRGNIQRLLNGTERKISAGSKTKGGL
ncbi:glycerol-3-phosphate 1-O-acyltransferase PlsY [Alkaliphilus pronyensis]|uniref:Glycerol-3-phosphate acyltransferase n=1 Tax=Alkaliphilus pronyensis TaxID=1482732 RepID=A0A6I0FH44_9FIRM|nr:glycerol-3-phosphate 1-O-acyltransferase PlsY [Alkaliphilus pronyensis]KAB3538556.1 glycerol-3-phosphate 1-O-acyltransferase PlsY [Alkaliphilus pronyensis]